MYTHTHTHTSARGGCKGGGAVYHTRSALDFAAAKEKVKNTICVFFISINSSNYFMHRSIAVRSSKNEYFIRYFIVYIKLRNYFKSYNSKST